MASNPNDQSQGPQRPIGSDNPASATTTSMGFINPMMMQIINNASTNYQTQSYNDQRQTPAFFRGKKLRSGKWIPQEEKYAKILIQLFEKGLLLDCQDGISLRTYLSQKLHCAPMRISKKFAGKSIGKNAYKAKVKQGCTDKNYKDGQQKITAAMEDFYKTLPRSATEYLPQPGLRNTPPYPSTSIQNQSPMNPQLGAWQMQMAQLLLLQRQQQQQPVNGMPLNMAGAQQVSQVQVTSQQQSQPQLQTPVNPVPSGASVGSLHPSMPPPMSNSTSQQPSRPFESSIEPENPPTMPNNSAPLHTQMLPSQDYVKTTETPTSSDSPQQNDASQNTAAAKQLFDLQASFLSALQQQQSQAMANETNLQGNIGSYSSFADSIDQHAMKVGHSSVPGQSSLLNTSSFTSRSFDDFHKHLGAYLPTTENEGNEATRNSSAGSDFPNIFDAESYANFAQESANAASMHSAYMTNAVAWNEATSGSFDVTNTVHLLSQHVPVSTNVWTSERTNQDAPVSTQLTTPDVRAESQTRVDSSDSYVYNQVSETSTSATETETTSGPDSNESNNSSEENNTEESNSNDSNESDSGSSSGDEVKRKRRVAFEDEVEMERENKKARAKGSD